jgi:nucleoside-diphosphate-sugar epimerase
MATAYGMHDVLDRIERRCRVLPGDVTEPGCGVHEALLPPAVEEVWHCAASLKFRDSDRAEIELHNVKGTRHVAELALRLGARALNYISTAYVAGEQTGRIAEEAIPAQRRANNAYERSKMAAEAVVARLPLKDVRIMRPSIVIGHSETLAAPTNSGLYGFADEMTTFRNRVARRLGNYLEHYPVALLGDPLALVNLVPVDMVARAAVRLSQAGAPRGYYHLTNSEPTSVDEAVRGVISTLGIHAPRWVSDRAELTSIDDVLRKGLEFQGTYMLQNKIFDASRTRRYCGEDLLTLPLRAERISEFVAHYLRGSAEQAATTQKAPHSV